MTSFSCVSLPFFKIFSARLYGKNHRTNPCHRTTKSYNKQMSRLTGLMEAIDGSACTPLASNMPYSKFGISKTATAAAQSRGRVLIEGSKRERDVVVQVEESIHTSSRVAFTQFSTNSFNSLRTDWRNWRWSGRRQYKLVRPLLNFSRSEITRFCQYILIPVYPDRSNQEMYYSRNRIRKLILPSLQLFLNPQIENSLFRFAEWIAKDKLIY